MWSGEHPFELLATDANEGGSYWFWHGRSSESWRSVPKCSILNVLILGHNCVMGFHGWKYRERMEIQLQWKWRVFDCIKCNCNRAVHKMRHPQSRLDVKNSLLARMHTIWTLGLNKGMCKWCIWELFHFWHVRWVWWTHKTAFMVLDELDALECT